MNLSFLLMVALLVNGSLLAGSESRALPSEQSLDERVQLLRGNDGSWRIPDSVRGGTPIVGRQGTQGAPLTVYDVSGIRVGEVYQVRSSEKYVGLLLVANENGRAVGLTSGFSEVEWPLDQVAREVTLNDLDNPLFEPSFFLTLDEDRLLLRVNLGKKELELDDVYLSTDEIRRGKNRLSARELDR